MESTEDVSSEDKSEQKLIEHLQALASCGLQDLMDFLTQYSWMQERATRPGSKAGLRRFLKHNAVGLIAFMLDGKRSFSESECGFPNVYLVNFQEGDVKRGYPKTHRHTYFLKYLILRYICRKQEEGETVKPTRAIELFSLSDAKDAEKAGVFEEGLVRSCLSVMSGTGGTLNLIELGGRPTDDLEALEVSSLGASKRALHGLIESRKLL